MDVKHPRTRVRGFRKRSLGLAVAVASSAAAVLTSIAVPQVASAAVPTFVDGLAQPVFSADSSDWVHDELWVESSVDNDGDGRLDRIHVDVTRPHETETDGLKVPVIYEDSPYYAGIGPGSWWPVDHELGQPPTSKPRQAPFETEDTSPTISTIYESTWLPRGFAVVHSESPGTGLSEGCPTGGRNETLAGKAVIDWLNGRAKGFTSLTSTTEVAADWTTGKVAMMGTSYNGTLPIQVATTGVEGLEAIVPISAISSVYDYRRSDGALINTNTNRGGDQDVLAESVYSRADQEICQAQFARMRVEEDRVTGDYNAFWDDRNYMNDVRNVHAAVLLAHGTNDGNVKMKNAAQFYEALKAQGVPHMFYLHQGGHGGAPPDVMINRWFTRYLYGVHNGVEELPRSWVVRESYACPARQTTAAGEQSNTATLAVADSGELTLGFTATIPVTAADGTVSTQTRLIASIPDSTHVTLASAVATGAGQRVADGASVRLACGSANPTPYPEWPDPRTGDATLNLTPGGRTAGGLLRTHAGGSSVETLTDDATINPQNLVAAPSSPNRLVYKTPPLRQQVRISGAPSVSLRLAIDKPRANLTMYLVSYPATGNPTVITRGWADPLNRNSLSHEDPMAAGEFYPMRFALQPTDHVFAVGERIGLVVMSSDNIYTIRPAPGTQLSVRVDRSSLDLPVVGGPSALIRATCPVQARTCP
ncbi:Xaa-Pro dipeptidyl-peptidase [Actinopolymorpha pittospori]